LTPKVDESVWKHRLLTSKVGEIGKIYC
jgi:hypothetical protein